MGLQHEFRKFLKQRFTCEISKELVSQIVYDTRNEADILFDEILDILPESYKEKFRHYEELLVQEMGELNELSYERGIKDCGQLLNFILGLSTQNLNLKL